MRYIVKFCSVGVYMKVIGLTGPSGAGKGMAASFFEYHNIRSIDADAVYHDVITPPSACLDELTLEFGEEIINDDGSLDRKKLASIVFFDTSKKKQERLNAITHKYVLEQSLALMKEHECKGEKAIIFDVPLLFESGFDSVCDVTISVIADKSTRIERIMERDKITKEAASARIEAQMPDSFYVSRSDHVIYNNASIDDIRIQVDKIIDLLEADLF